MMNASEYLRTLYSDFLSSGLTVDTFADKNELHPTDIRRLLSIGKFLHEDYVELIKGYAR